MIHERLDIERWKAMFPLVQLRADARREVEGYRLERPTQYPPEESCEPRVAGNRLPSPPRGPVFRVT